MFCSSAIVCDIFAAKSERLIDNAALCSDNPDYLRQGIMVSLAFVCLFLAGYRKKLFNGFLQHICWKGGIWATEKPLDFGGRPNPHHVTSGLTA